MTTAKRYGEASIERGSIVVRVPIANIKTAVEACWSAGVLGVRLRVLDDLAFAKDMVNAMNDEEEDGTTPVMKLLDQAVEAAFESGSNSVEEHPEQST